MKVKRVGQLILEDSVRRYYELKKLGQCPKCNAAMQFTTDARKLVSSCSPTCTNTMTVHIPRMLTYDKKIERDKAALNQLIEDVLVAKFDFLFQHSAENLDLDLKTAYIEARQEYNDTQSVLMNKIREPDLRAEQKTLREASGNPAKRKDWCNRFKRFKTTEARVQFSKYKGATTVLDMMPYTWAELEVAEINIPT